MTELELTFSSGGTVRAELLAEDAPRTSAAALNALPFEAEVKHASFFGPALRARVGAFAERVENPFVLGVRAGEILVRPAATDGQQDLIVAFGHVLFLEDRDWVQHSLFARVVPGDLEALIEIGKRIRTRGAERIAVSASTASA